MSTLYVEPAQVSNEVLRLVQTAIEGEILKLELALKMAKKRLAQFEEKYGVPSDYFIEKMAAEDLEGGDDEYVQWAGEYWLMRDLEEKLARLKEIKYAYDRGIRSPS